MKKYLDETGLQTFASGLTNVFAPIGAVGSPLVASTAAAMTDTSKVYVYTGTEDGYTSGDWYYYDGAAWVSGGVYNAVAIADNSITDAKLVQNGGVLDSVERLEERFDFITGINLLNPNTITNGKYLYNDGTTTDNAVYFISDFIPVEYGKTYFWCGIKDSNRAQIRSTRHVSLLYDATKAPISETYQNVDGTPGLQVEVNNANAKYARVCVHTESGWTWQFTESSTYTEYAPYWEKYVLDTELGNTPVIQLQNTETLVPFCINHGFPMKRTRQLFDRSKTETGYYDGGGWYYTSSSYVNTGFIDVSDHVGDTIYFSINSEAANARFICGFDSDKHAVSGAGAQSVTSYTVPSGVSFIIISYKNPANGGNDAKFARFQAEYDEITPFVEYGIFFDPTSLPTGNVLYGKKWTVLGDSFTNGATNTKISSGKYAGLRYIYPYLIGNRNEMNIVKFFEGGRTLAYPASEDFTNSICNPSADWYYQNIPADTDYITIYLGINDSHHEEGIGGDGEDPTGIIPLGTITDNTTATYYGAWNVVLTWLITNRPFAHIGIIVSNGCDREAYRTAQLEIAKKYGVPYIDLNGDSRTPVMIRSQNPDIASAVKTAVNLKQRVAADNTHPNDSAHEYESYFIENFLRSI